MYKKIEVCNRNCVYNKLVILHWIFFKIYFTLQSVFRPAPPPTPIASFYCSPHPLLPRGKCFHWKSIKSGTVSWGKTTPLHFFLKAGHGIQPWAMDSNKLARAPGVDPGTTARGLQLVQASCMEGLFWSYRDFTSVSLAFTVFHELGSAIFVYFSIMILNSSYIPSFRSLIGFLELEEWKKKIIVQ